MRSPIQITVGSAG
jgi:hypothetical protein